MKIVLTTLPAEGEYVNWTTPSCFQPSSIKYMPLGILSLASNLPEKYEVMIFDPASHGWSLAETIERIENEKPDVLGLSAVTRRVYALNEILKKTSAGYKVVGGPHATCYSKQILEKGADSVFVGPLADKEFAQAIELMPKGVIACNTKIEEINYPQRALMDHKFYFTKVAEREGLFFQAHNRLPMFSSIGCPNRCNFCNVQSKRVQRKSPGKIVEEMEYLYSLGCRSIHMLDDNFNVNELHLCGILDEMDRKQLQVEWSGRGQARMSESLAKNLADHNFKRIHVGIEALDDKILKYYNKNSSVSGIAEFCERMTKNRIDILGYFIIGSPLDTENSLFKLPQKIIDLGIKYPFFNMLFPEPNTEYYSNLLKEEIYKKDHWEEYMQEPTPYFEIPYPYGENRKKEIVSYLNELINNFEQNR